MPLTAHRLITRSLSLIGAFGEGQTPTADALNDGLETLNDMVDGWAVDGLTVRALERKVFPMRVGMGKYLCGPAADFDVAKPSYIDAFAYYIDNDQSEYRIDPADDVEWASISNKLQGGDPQRAHYGNSTSGLEFAIDYWPVPSRAMFAVLYLPTVIVRFKDLITQYTFPAGYVRALRYNLALDLAPEYETSLDAIVVNKAAEYLADVRRTNIKPRLIAPDGPMAANAGGFYNIYTDR